MNLGDQVGRTIIFADRPCILCVDDDQQGLSVRGHLLRRSGYVVVLVDHPALVSMLDLSAYQLAIVDFEMPGMNGTELAEYLRLRGATFPIVLLSGATETLTPQQERLFAKCLHKGESAQSILTVVTSLAPTQEPSSLVV